MTDDLRKQINTAIEYMAMCIGESKEERRDDVSVIFQEMEAKITQLISDRETALKERILAGLPEKQPEPRKKDPRFVSFNETFDDAFILGWNAASDEVTTAIENAFKEDSHGDSK